jgi:hypothetical protein
MYPAGALERGDEVVADREDRNAAVSGEPLTQVACRLHMVCGWPARRNIGDVRRC